MTGPICKALITGVFCVFTSHVRAQGLTLSPITVQFAHVGDLVVSAPACGLRSQAWADELNRRLEDAIKTKAGDGVNLYSPGEDEIWAGLGLLHEREAWVRNHLGVGRSVICETARNSPAMGFADQLASVQQRAHEAMESYSPAEILLEGVIVAAPACRLRDKAWSDRLRRRLLAAIDAIANPTVRDVLSNDVNNKQSADRLIELIESDPERFCGQYASMNRLAQADDVVAGARSPWDVRY